jgi:hypothetical protein
VNDKTRVIKRDNIEVEAVRWWWIEGEGPFDEDTRETKRPPRPPQRDGRTGEWPTRAITEGEDYHTTHLGASFPLK